MTEQRNDSEIVVKTQFIIDHLEKESEYLDTVFACSKEIQSSLRKHREQKPAATANRNGTTTLNLLSFTPEQKERNRELTEMMNRIRTRMSDSVEPILPSRLQFVQTLRSLVPESDRAPSLSALSKLVDEPFRSTLRGLGEEIRAKVRKVHAVSMGNQAVLIYTMDFINRLLTGISSGDQCYGNSYSSTGKTFSRSTGNFVQTNG